MVVQPWVKRACLVDEYQRLRMERTSSRAMSASAQSCHRPRGSPLREYVTIGGLMAYAVDLADVLRRAAQYVDAILKGMKPGEMLIYQVDKFHTIVNLKTAKTQGVILPATLVGRADK